MEVLVWIMFSFVVRNLRGFFTDISSLLHLTGGQLVIRREGGQITVRDGRHIGEGGALLLVNKHLRQTGQLQAVLGVEVQPGQVGGGGGGGGGGDVAREAEADLVLTVAGGQRGVRAGWPALLPFIGVDDPELGRPPSGFLSLVDILNYVTYRIVVKIICLNLTICLLRNYDVSFNI